MNQNHTLLLEPGWAGDLTLEELNYIKASLKKDRKLRAKWAMGRGTGRVNDGKIRIVAVEGTNGQAKLFKKTAEAVQGMSNCAGRGEGG